MNKIQSKSGIISYGAYLPKYRVTSEEIAKTYNRDPKSIKDGLGIIEKTVPAKDEDTITIAVNAATQAYKRISPLKEKIGAIYVGSESHPYAVKSTSAIVGEALGLTPNFTAADLEFACKAGTAGMQMVFSHVDSGRIDAGIAAGADTAQGAPGDMLEFSAACASAAFIIGNNKPIAKLIHTTSFTTDTPDFWRREHEKYPTHGGRFTGEPAYLKHIVSATKNILEETNSTIKDYNHVIFHMPNGKFPQVVAKILGVDKSQMKFSFVVPYLGNSYSACSMIGLVNVLDNANPGEKILMTSYGSGAGSDSFVFEVTDEIVAFRAKIKNLEFDKMMSEQMERKEYLTYGQYVRHVGKL